MPRPRRAVALLAVLPAGLLGHRLDHRPRARVLQMRETEGDRIGAGRSRQLVHEGFEREHVGIGAERAQRRDADRHVLDEMVDHPLAREIVERNGVAVAAAGRLRRAASAVPSSAARRDTRPPARWCRRSIPAASSGCCSTPRIPSRRSCRRRRARPWRASPWPGHRAPSRTRRRASIAGGPAGRAPRAPAARRRAATSSAPLWP